MRFTVDLPTLTFGCAALGNLMALVWGAAKISGAVDRLTKWADRAEEKLEKLDSRVSKLEGARS